MQFTQLKEKKQVEFLQQAVRVKTAFAKAPITGILTAITRNGKTATVKFIEPVYYQGSNEKLRRLSGISISTAHIHV
jgi:hypothetical protein